MTERNPGEAPGLRCLLGAIALRFGGNERRYRAVEGVSNGAEHFGFGFANKAIGGDGLGAGVEDVFLNLWGRLGKTIQRGVDLRQIALFSRNKRYFGLRGIA